VPDMMSVAHDHTASGTAPGKVILLGEHAVVYGRTALAAAIDRHVTVRLAPSCDSQASALREPQGDRNEGHQELEMAHQPFVLRLSKHALGADVPADPRLIAACARAADIAGLLESDAVAILSSNLPIAMGLGSSAALSVALLRALAQLARRPLDDAAICAGAFELERIFHGFPSGIDNTVAAYGGLIAFTRGAPVRPLQARRSLPLVVALGGAPRRTQQTVTALRRKWEVAPEICEPLFDEIGALVGAAEGAIAAGDLTALGAAMSANHRVLRHLGVSTDELEAMVQVAGRRGALGAKLTGGGGGGAVICLCDGDRKVLIDSFTRAGWRAFSTDIVATPRGAHAGDSPTHVDEYAAARA
jgi:mevalonate kinase